ncbi:MAG: response regulator [Nannocystaceae bacterium]
MSTSETIFIVDDDESVLRSLGRLFLTEGYSVDAFSSPQDLLEERDPERAGCVVLDLRMPQMSGLEVQEALRQDGLILPIVFISGSSDVPAAVHAIKGGALDFLLKPFDEDALLEAVGRAVERGRRQRRRRDEHCVVEARLARLTPRELQVARLVTEGLLSKQIAAELGTAESTIALHRSRIMRKLEVDSVAELVRLFIGPLDDESESAAQ